MDEADDSVFSHRQLAALHEVYSRHARVGPDGTAELGLEEFRALARAEGLVLENAEELFVALAGRSGAEETVSFEEFCCWIKEKGGKDWEALAKDVSKKQHIADAWAGAARMLVSALRPLSGLALVQVLLAFKVKVLGFGKLGLLLLKKGMFFCKAKAALSLEASIKNPARLFRRQVFSPLDDFRHPLGIMEGLRREARAGGVRGLSTKAMAPYAVNAGIAVAMFHTYTTVRLYLHGLAAEHPALDEQPLLCDALAATAAGSVQATLHTPLYNVRLGRDDQIAAMNIGGHRGLFKRLRELHVRAGLKGCFQNYPFVVAQEVCSLIGFFTSYEYFKQKTTTYVRHHVDDSGDRDLYAWAMAACGSGVFLAAVGTPFENLLTWHVARREKAKSKSVLRHFLQSSPKAKRTSVLFSGMRTKLLSAPLAGLPLLAYEVMMHQGMAPKLH
ncbi:Hypothetical protein (Fragment) [Durusdinium trenchii]|uniref:Uncharacterized protein n=1 Tax=Durusdinium trenchii TaxID=1381693 RepID=A0ABP0HVZ3_9DINO